MTEEIIVEEETAKAETKTAKKREGILNRLKRSPQLLKFKKEKKKPQGEMNKLDLTLIWVTGFTAFCGLMFTAVMIILLRSINY